MTRVAVGVTVGVVRQTLLTQLPVLLTRSWRAQNPRLSKWRVESDRKKKGKNESKQKPASSVPSEMGRS